MSETRTSQMIEVLHSCPICGQGDLIDYDLTVDPEDPFTRLIPEGGKLGWSRCKECSFLFQNPRLCRSAAEVAYGDSLYRTSDNVVKIEQGYIDWNVHQLSRYFLWFLSLGFDLRELRNAVCLDYGAGIGGAMNFLADQDNRLFGVEPDRNLAEFGNKTYRITIVPTLEELPAGQRYDFIFSHHSLEHVYDPNDFVRFAAESLTDKGVLAIVVPTWRFANTRYSMRQISASHYSGFEHVSLSRLLNKHGLFMIAHNYQNTVPTSEEWEICALAVRSPRRNHFSSTPEADVAEHERNAPARADEKAGSPPPGLVEKISAMTETVAQAQATSSREAPAQPAAAAAVPVNRISLETILLYLVSKLISDPPEAAAALLGQVNRFTIDPSWADTHYAPARTSQELAARVQSAYQKIVQGDFGSGMNEARMALRDFCTLVESGGRGDAQIIANWLFSGVSEGTSWPLDTLLGLVAGACGVFGGREPTESDHLLKLAVTTATEGRANDFMAWAASVLHPAQPVKSAEGIFGADQLSAFPASFETVRKDGYHVFASRLPEDIVGRLRQFAETTPGYASYDGGWPDRKEPIAFAQLPPRADGLELPLGSVVANRDVQRLMSDPSIIAFAQDYLGCEPIIGPPSFWWSLPSDGAPNSGLAQYFHYDMDWWKFLKIFFYLTDVDDESGPHFYIRGSHRAGVKANDLLRRGYARIPDQDILAYHPAESMVSITGPSGTIFAGDTSCWHKGAKPLKRPRLVLQLQFTASIAHCDKIEKQPIGPEADPRLRRLFESNPHMAQYFTIE